MGVLAPLTFISPTRELVTRCETGTAIGTVETVWLSLNVLEARSVGPARPFLGGVSIFRHGLAACHFSPARLFFWAPAGFGGTYGDEPPRVSFTTKW